MFKKRREAFGEAQVQPTWNYLVGMERRLRRNKMLCRIIQPVGTILFLFNLLLATVNLGLLWLGETLAVHFEAVPFLPALVEKLPRTSTTGAIVFLLLFSYLIPLAVSGSIAGIVWLVKEKRNPPEKRPLNGTPAQCAKALAREAETVYSLRRSIPKWSIYLETGILTALTAIPVVVTLLEYAKSEAAAALQIALLCGLLLICLFVLFWVYALLFQVFSVLNSLFYYSPGEWALYDLYQTADAYWESVDPIEFAKREQRVREQLAPKERKPRREQPPAPPAYDEEDAYEENEGYEDYDEADEFEEMPRQPYEGEMYGGEYEEYDEGDDEPPV